MKEENVFTRHVQTLLSGGEVDSAVVEHLADAVKGQLRRKGSWDSSPSHLGYQGGAWHEGALDDLVQDCYLACILKNLSQLAQRIHFGAAIDAMVHQKIRWFLTDRQRQSNPIGYRVFANLRGASESLGAAGNAQLSDIDVSNTTIVLAPGKSQPLPEEQLRRAFAADLAAESFVSAVCRCCDESERLVEQRILAAFSQGLDGYRIGDLTAVFREAAQQQLRASGAEPALEGIVQKDFEDFSTAIRTVSPDARYEENEAFERRYEALAKRVDAEIRNSRVRDRVQRVLDHLVTLIREGDDIAKLDQAAVARELGIATSTLNEDIQRLRRLLQQTQEASEGGTNP